MVGRLVQSLTLALWARTAVAGTGDDDLDALVDHLVAAGLHEQAFSEVLQASLSAETPERAHELEIVAGTVLWRAEDWGAASRYYQHLGLDPDARMGLAYSLYREGRTTPALSVLGSMDEPLARYLAGWSYLRERRAVEAVAAWKLVPEGGTLGEEAASLVADLGEPIRIPRRSPGLAGGLSAVLPGAGQAYVGRWGEATSALIVNGLLIAASVQLYREEQWFAGGFVTFIGVGFYGGNIFSAANGAHRFNRESWRRTLQPLSASRDLELERRDGAWVPR